MRLYLSKTPLVVILFAFTILACAAARASDVIQPAELAERINAGSAPLILDVRTPQEYAAGHIPGAINIPHTELSQRLSELLGYEDTEIVLHCRSGRRSGMVKPILLDAGFKDLRDLDGHMLRWEAEGYPVQ